MSERFEIVRSIWLDNTKVVGVVSYRNNGLPIRAVTATVPEDVDSSRPVFVGVHNEMPFQGGVTMEPCQVFGDDLPCSYDGNYVSGFPREEPKQIRFLLKRLRGLARVEERRIKAQETNRVSFPIF